MSIDPTTALIAALGVEPDYSARQAAALLGRSYSWLDQGLRDNKFVLPDGTKVEPSRAPGGYRRFSLQMLEEMAACSYRRSWFSMGELKFTPSAICSGPPTATPVGPRSRTEGLREVPASGRLLAAGAHKWASPQSVRSRVSSNSSQPSEPTA